MEKQQNLRPVEELPNISDLILNKQNVQFIIDNAVYRIEDISKNEFSYYSPNVNIKPQQEQDIDQNNNKSIPYLALQVKVHLGEIQVKMPDSYSTESEAKDKQLIKYVINQLSEQNDKVDIKTDLKTERLSEYNHPNPLYNDSIDKTIKIPDKTEIANNPNFEIEKGIDKNGVQMADDKSINTIAQDYVKGQEREIERKMFNMPESDKSKSDEMER